MLTILSAEMNKLRSYQVADHVDSEPPVEVKAQIRQESIQGCPTDPALPVKID